MLDDTTATPAAENAGESTPPVVKTTTRKRAARSTAKKAAPQAAEVETAPVETAPVETAESAPAKKAAAKRAPAKKAAAKKAPAKKAAPRKAAAQDTSDEAQTALDLTGAPEAAATEAPAAPVVKKTTRKRTTRKVAAAPVEAVAPEAPVAAAPVAEVVAEEAPAKKAAKRAPRKTAAKKVAAPVETVEAPEAAEATDAPVVKRTTRKRTTKKTSAPVETAALEAITAEADAADDAAPAAPMALFQVPAAQPKVTTRRRGRKIVEPEPIIEEIEDEEVLEDPEAAADETADAAVVETDETTADGNADNDSDNDADNEEDEDDAEGSANGRRRRRRGGRRRRRSGNDSGDGETGDDAESAAQGEDAEEKSEESAEQAESADDAGSSSRRRRRRRRSGDNDNEAGDDPENTVTRVRRGRALEDQITAVSGSTRLEAKKQRRREGREAGRRRAPIISEAEFLARREAVDRQMVIRQRDELTQIGVLEDKVLVEHYVARESQTSMIGNVYLGRVQNVLPSMEAAFIDIGKGRNAVLYAGEVNWAALGHREGQARKIESVLSSGQSILVQVTKDPIGHKGARLSSQVSLAGRFLVYVPDGTNSGISRKLPDTERSRLKKLLKEIVPEHAGVIVRTAAEGASEAELTEDVERLKARWADIEAKSSGGAQGPKLLYGEPDLTLKVVRDLFTEDFTKLVIEGEDAWETVQGYVQDVAPDLLDRVEKFVSPVEGRDEGKDIFGVHRVEEQIAKGLDRKVWLPSGGSLVIDRTEAMTVIDVNTGKFTGSGGNLEETVTKNNLEAAEEVVRQLRLRDIGGIIVVDFIDMVLESNRDLVVRRLVECLGRDRTRHQVAEVTSLGLVQMTRKRIGTGLLETFGHDCSTCHGRGVVVEDQPVEPRRSPMEEDNRRGRNRRGKGQGGDSAPEAPAAEPAKGSAKDIVNQIAAKTAAPAHAEVPEVIAVAEVVEAPAEAVEVTDENAVTVQRSSRSSRSRRGRRSRSETVDVADVTPDVAEVVAEVVVAEAVAEVVVETTPEVVVEIVEEVVAEVAAAEKPAVRRRSRRQATVIRMEPSQPDAPAPAPVVEPAAVVPDKALVQVSEVDEDQLDLVELAAEQEAAQEPVQEAVAVQQESTGPVVVTRTRRRSARRPAGPPADETLAAEHQEAPEEGADSVAHVPMKKKGTRKR